MHPHTVGDGDIEITRTQNRNYALAEGFRRVAKESNALSLLMRYQQQASASTEQAERQYRRAIEEFERLKRLRPELPSELNLQTEPDSPEDIATLCELNPSAKRVARAFSLWKAWHKRFRLCKLEPGAKAALTETKSTSQALSPQLPGPRLQRLVRAALLRGPKTPRAV